MKDISIFFSKGKLTSIIGPTGCGKTTLLRIIAGLEKPDEGNIKFSSKKITMIFQQHTLFPWRNALSNVMFPLEVQRIQKKESLTIAKEKLAVVGMKEHMYKKIYELSGGMQQRVQFARALASDPNIMLLDEPFSSLDEITRYSIQKLLLEILTKSVMTSVFVTHNIDEAVFLSDRIILMGIGHISDVFEIDQPHPRDRDSLWFSEMLLSIRKRFNRIIDLANS